MKTLAEVPAIVNPPKSRTFKRREFHSLIDSEFVEVNIVSRRGLIEVHTLIKCDLDIGRAAQDEIERHWRQCLQCGLGRGHNPVRGIGPYGLSLRIRPEHEEHWAAFLADVLAKPGALVAESAA
jgi:hypothetical protein